jgi:hypothetical protein
MLHIFIGRSKTGKSQAVLEKIRALGDIVSTRDNDHDGVAELFERLGL